jgi:hypothetical protein
VGTLNEIILDPYSLLLLARSLKARHDALDIGMTADEADTAFKKIFVLPYSQDRTITALEQYPNLNEQLIVLLSIWTSKLVPLKRKPLGRDGKQQLSDANDEWDREWDKYELLRRLSAYDARSLLVQKDHLELGKTRHK